MTDLDAMASRAVYAAHLLENAIHATDGWTISWGPHEVPAIREVLDDGVRITAIFPETCYLDRSERNAVLRLNGEVVAVRNIGHPGDTGFAITWDLASKAAETVR